MTLMRIQGLKGGYGGEDIVKGIDLALDAGDFAVIIGPNGAGKSTFLKMICGLVNFHSGSIEMDGRPLTGGQALSASGIGFVPQEFNVFPSMTVRENLEIGCYLKPRDVKRRIDEQLARFPLLADRLRLPARTLSGGQRQTLALAIALMMAPRVLLLDEPSAGLSPVAASAMFDTVSQLSRDGIAVLMIEQNALAALAIAQRGIVFVMGQKVRDAVASDLVLDPETRRLFLGGQPETAHL
ncbi:ABC transporter ATP-binding protein [Variovorax sp. LG9.2]|uniref:ABC transporter ATP-binding protein n=1 Tax=Variovorax sp. LG9.2 TaxID=3048626 RepID=UPI002B23402D|nr:ATP-binding cassette domain-containing protein [Variovorax sp. LG9.2]MEB0060278.1 ATP-binding cassette domain-containing protein [Variovorax sp. LG9.2]